MNAIEAVRSALGEPFKASRSTQLTASFGRQFIPTSEGP